MDSVKRHAGILWIIAVFFVLVLASTPSHGATDSAEADFTPWSGYWWPSNNGGLATGIDYRGHPAPLEKYELLKNGTYPGEATQWYLDHNYDPSVPRWYGLCGAWAAASVSENITFYPSIIDKIIFNVGDKKGLLTACHENNVTIRVNSHQPEIFHAWLLQYIKDEGIAFYAELDPGEEVWNYPVYRYEMETLNYGNKLSVTCQIWYADDQVDPDYQGTKARTKIYTYVLYTGGNGEITSGEWTGTSLYDHPQQLMLPVTPNSDNPYLDYAFIRSLAGSRDDELESDQTMDINPGGYDLILLNEDAYRIRCDEGDTILLHMEKENDLEEGIRVAILDADGGVVYSDTLREEKDVQITALRPPYTLTFAVDDVGGGLFYHLDFDLKKAFEHANTKIQKGFAWGGFGITNAGDVTCDRIYVVGYGRDGLPTDTYLGPFSLAPGEKRTALQSDFDVSVVERDDFTAVKILAPMELEVVNLFGYFEKNMSGYGHRDGQSRFVIPDTSTWWDFSRTVSWGIYNPELEDRMVGMELFSPNGELVDSVSVTLPANRAVHYNSSDFPFVTGEDGGWIVVEDEGDSLLQGYCEWVQSGIKKAEALGTLDIGTSFFVPQVAHTSFWGQSITLMNVSGRINPVTLTLVDGVTLSELEIQLAGHEKRTVNIADLFSSLSSAALNRAALVVEAGEEMAGFVTFTTSNDDAAYPLLTLNDVSQDLVIPHVASNNYWWTGIALFNPFDEEVHVRVLPYDTDGQPMEQNSVDRFLGGQKKGIYTIKGLFGNHSGDISFVTLQVVSGAGIAGFYSMGNRDCTMLSGAVMK